MTFLEIIRKFNLDEEEKKIYLDYVANRFENRKSPMAQDYEFLERWHRIVEFSQMYSAAEALNRFVCLKYPVEYKKPDDLHMEIYSSFAGDIPMIYVPDTDDFENLVTNAVYKGIRPEHIEKTGASFAFGKTTRFMILSAKPYSNVPALEIGLKDEEWIDRSIRIRREHECVHYYTKQFWGIARNCLHDELIADFFGIYEAFGFYKADYFLHFIGAKGTNGNRLEVYTQGLPQRVFEAVKETAVQGAMILENWSESDEFSKMTKKQRVDYLCRLGLQGILESLVFK